MKAAVESNALIYAVGVFSDEDRKSNKKMIRKSKKDLTTLAEATGGLAYFPDNSGRSRFRLHQDRPRHPQSVHHRLLPDEYSQGRQLPRRASRIDSAKRTRETFRPHAHRILRQQVQPR